MTNDNGTTPTENARPAQGRSFLALPQLRLPRRGHSFGSWRLTAEDEASRQTPQEFVIRVVPGPSAATPLAGLPEVLAGGTTHWIDLTAPDSAAAPLLQDQLRLSALSVKHLLQPARMPKLDVLPDGGVVVVLFALRLEEGEEPRLHAKPVGFLIREEYLVTTHHGPIDLVERRLSEALQGNDVARPNGFALATIAIDALVDEHLAVTLRSAELAEELEERLDPANELESITALERLIVLRRDLLAVRRLGVAQQEVIRRLIRLFPDQAAPLEDVLINQREAVETATAVCEYIDGAIEAYRLRREVRTEIGIRRLTVLASILGIASILMGLWGVNFAEIPGSNEPWGWFAFTGALILFLLLAIWYVRRRGLW